MNWLTFGRNYFASHEPSVLTFKRSHLHPETKTVLDERLYYEIVGGYDWSRSRQAKWSDYWQAPQPSSRTTIIPPPPLHYKIAAILQ